MAKTYQDTQGNTFNTREEALASINKLKAVNPTDLKPSNPPVLQPTTPSNTSPINLSDISTMATNAGNEQNNAITDYLKTLTDQGDIQGKEAGYVTAEGGDKALKEYNQYKSDLEAEQRALEVKKREILKNNPTGALRGGQQDLINNLERDSLQKQADIAILANSAQGRYDTALTIAKNKVESELAPIKAQLEAKKFYIEQKSGLWNAQQMAEANRVIRAEERAYDEAKNEKEKIESIKIEAYKNGFRGDFSNVTNLDEALKKVGGYLMSPMEKLQMEKLRGDIAKNSAELALAKQTIGGTTGNPIADIIAGSARYGDKRLTDSQLEKIQKATTALGSMETLQSLLSQGKDGVNVSGPVTGRLRTLATQLGGDANASAINATIQGLIPTVARGIFGEVGVLTDSDIENYRKTVPNLKATGEQNKLISLVMYDVLSRSLENTLVSNARNQTNVSGFLTDYQDVKNRIGVLKSNLGVVEQVPISSVANSYLDSKLGSGVVDSINSAITNYSSQFTRKP